MNIFLFDSHSLEANAAELFTQLKKDGVGIFSDAMIVVAHPSVKEWLQMELCKLSPCKSTMGLNFLGWRKAVQILSGESFFPSLAEIGAAIWQSLEREPIAACEQFLDSESKSIDFVFHLARIFSEYNEYGFPEKFPESMRWQKDLFESIFKRTLDEAIVIQSGPIYVFGVDVMPPSVLRFFFKCDLFRLFRFSPCAMFWEDFCSTAERKRILKSLEKKQFKASQLEALDQLLIDTQPLLANWGKLGRKMLALVPEVTAENYVIDETEAQLTGLKLDLLLSSQEHRDLSSDGSIRLIRTGSSRCNEVLSLQHELLHYAAQGISFSDMRVYAPDIGLYAPIIEFCFKDIPFRIAGVDIARKSPFYQAILLLFSCVKGRWESDVILSLLEMPVVHKKAGWKIEEVNRIAQWIHRSGIRWGLDGRHRGELAGVSTVEGSGGWESGIDSLLDSWMFFQPEKESSVGWSESELFEKFYSFFETLRATLISWNKERSLFDWAIEIQQLIELYLWSDGDSISEKEISQSLQYIRSLGELYPEDLFPFSFIEKFFFTDISGELGASSLHSVRFASLELGAMMPAKVVFVLGMDEESFPRAPLHSSLRLPNHVAVTRSESDRYLFLSLIFSAKDHLIFSYGHISGDDGKVVSPSLLIQELFGYLKNSQSETYVAESVESEKATPSLLTHSVPSELDASIQNLSIQDLSKCLKNPFQNYLKQVLGLTLEEEPESAWKEFEFSSLSKHWMLRSYLEEDVFRETELPLGLFGPSALKVVDEETRRFSKSLEDWGISHKSIHSISFDQAVSGVRLFGESNLAVPEGALHLGSDNIGSVLRRWTEILSILVAKGKNKVFFLKTGKIREIENPEKALAAAITLSLQSKDGPLFIHPEWADSLLRKKVVPDISDLKDPVLQWVLSRSPGYDLALDAAAWNPALENAFASLISLYPTRSVKNAEV